ncbi:hypothetical protein [Agreia sp.]
MTDGKHTAARTASGFTASNVLAGIDLTGIDLTGKTAIVTGGYPG